MTIGVVNEQTGEITEALNEAAARDLIDAIRVNLEDAADLIEQLWSGRGWLALGYGSWDALVAAEIRNCIPKLDRAQRKQAVADLAAKGMSTRAIGSALGTSREQVRRDLAAGDTNVSPQPDPASPRPTTGLDGKTYPARKPAPVVDPEAAAKTAERQRIARVFDRTRTILSLLEVLVSEGIDPDVSRALDSIQSAIASLKEKS